MAKLSLTAAPTFKAKVGIPVPGARPAEVEFTFKHKTRDEIDAWIDVRKDGKDEEALVDIIAAWELDDAVTAENIDRLCNVYPGATRAIFATYLEELRGARAKN